MAPELLDLRLPESELEEEEAPHVLPTTHSDVYSFGGLMLGSDGQCALPLLYARNASRACGLERDNADTAQRCAGRRTSMDVYPTVLVHHRYHSNASFERGDC